MKAVKTGGDVVGAANEVGKVEYHYGFYGAIHVEYEPTHIKMEYLQEHELGDEPVRMDMLLLKREKTVLTDPIGEFFREHNVLEYKSPEDSLSVSDFYKAQGYALLYKGMEASPDEISLDELTVSLFRHAYPREMLRKLKERGLTVVEAHPGVYRITGTLSVPTQVVVTSRLPAGQYSAFKALAKNTSKEDIIRLLSLADGSDASMIEYVRAVLNVSIVINEETVDEIKEAGIMPEAVRRVFKEEFEAERKEGRLEGREERSQEVYERMRAANIPEEQARALAFG